MQQEITETLVSFKVAELAKKKRFFVECRNYYNSDKKLCEAQYYEFDINNETSENSVTDILCTTPTQDLLRTWLLEIHSIHITIFSKSQESWTYRITTKGQSLKEGLYGEDFYSHDEAREEALFQALNLLPDVN